MARARCIYVVKFAHTSSIVAAFTVKHELKTWLDARPRRRELAIVYRCGDGIHQPDPVLIPDNELN